MRRLGLRLALDLGVGLGGGVVVLHGLLELADAAAERAADAGEPADAEDRDHDHEDDQQLPGSWHHRWLLAGPAPDGVGSVCLACRIRRGGALAFPDVAILRDITRSFVASSG